MENVRVDKTNYYLDIAETVASRSTCLRKKYGSVIVKNDEIISTGYNGAPRGRENCINLGYCIKKKLFPDIRHAGYDACRSVHAEQNAMLSVSRKDMIDSSLPEYPITTNCLPKSCLAAYSFISVSNDCNSGSVFCNQS